MKRLPGITIMRRAFECKDPGFDGIFVVAVKTTGIFCRPTCRAKPPLAKNVEFFADAGEALRNGYRPCLLCRPTESTPPPLVRRLMRLVDQCLPEPVGEAQIKDLGISTATARRQFRGYCGMSFAQYQRQRRVGAAMLGVNGGASVVAAQVACGFRSSSGFRAAVTRVAGVPASAAKGVMMLQSTWFQTPLGRMLAVARKEAVVFLEFIDGEEADAQLMPLRRRFAEHGAPAVIVPGENAVLRELGRELAEYFAGTRQRFATPIAPEGTPFELRAWDFLRSIPYGQTRSYGQQAIGIGSPKAVRAVGGANGRNTLAVIVPCHRVIGADGSMTGFGAGIERKRWLLELEKSHCGELRRATDAVAGEPTLFARL